MDPPSIKVSNVESPAILRSGLDLDVFVGVRRRSLASPATRTRNWAKSKAGLIDGVVVVVPKVLVVDKGAFVVVGVVVVVEVAVVLLLVLFDPPIENLMVNSGGKRTVGFTVEVVMLMLNLVRTELVVLDRRGM